MADKTHISWTDRTWNGWIGCQKVSDGCKNCYAERDFTRKPRWANTWGPPETTERKRTSEAYWKKPWGWNSQGLWKECVTCNWRGSSSGLVVTSGLHPPTCPNCNGNSFRRTRQRVFAFSLGDVFEDAPQVEEWREEFFRIAEQTTNINWLVLTKRIELVADFMPLDWFASWPSNIWIGTTIENDETLWRLEYLAALPAKVKFISFEPLIGRVPLTDYSTLPAFDWAIVGGESGPNARPMKEAWAIEIKDYCLNFNIPFHFKQWGEYSPVKSDLTGEVNYIRKGVRNIAPVLDGQEWKEFPVLETSSSGFNGPTTKIVI